VLSAATIAFAASGVALASLARAVPARLGSALCALSAFAACVSLFGVVRGAVVALVLAMTMASLLVLLLPQRPELARPIAIAGAVVGALLSALALR
jgi:hypothetical protein